MMNPTETITTVSAMALQSSEFESTMLSEDKLFVVLAVVLLIWAGIVVMLYRNDRKITALERKLEDVTSDSSLDE